MTARPTSHDEETLHEASTGPVLPNEETSEWRDVGPTASFVTLRLTVLCEHCSAPVPLNGPTKTANCRNCLKSGQLTRISEELATASEGMKTLGSPYRALLHKSPKPFCSQCDTAIPIEHLLSKEGVTTTIPCPKCGFGCPTYPAPQWLREELPAARQVFGGDPQTANAESGLELALPTNTPKPIAMFCPNCSGGLTITAESERTTECPYCHISVFLPDELWKQLHPVRTTARWTLTYAGKKLQTAKSLAEEAAERARENAKEERAKKKAAARKKREEKERLAAKAKAAAQREREEREERERAEEERARRKRAQRNLYWILAIGIAAGGAVFAVSFLL